MAVAHPGAPPAADRPPGERGLTQINAKALKGRAPPSGRARANRSSFRRSSCGTRSLRSLRQSSLPLRLHSSQPAMARMTAADGRGYRILLDQAPAGNSVGKRDQTPAGKMLHQTELPRGTRLGSVIKLPRGTRSGGAIKLPRGKCCSEYPRFLGQRPTTKKAVGRAKIVG